MTLIRTSILNAIAVIVKMLVMLGINKVLALYVGPAGYAVIGQFQNAIQMLITFASGAIGTGVTKYTAEYHDQPDKQVQVWRTASIVSIIGTFVSSVLIFLFNKNLAHWFLKDESYGSVFIWFGVSLIFFVLNSLLLAILNGKKEIKKYVIANISGSLFSAGVTILLVIKFGLYGALVGLAVYQSLNFFVVIFFTIKSSWFDISNFVGKPDKLSLVSLSRYTAMTLVSAFCVPISHILIRNHLGKTLGWAAAGYWEAMWRLSAAYLMFVTTTLSVYYLPRLSELKEPNAIRSEVVKGYKILLPITIVGGFIIYSLRDIIIYTFFTPDFLAIRELFAWQMIGDTLKIASWLLGFVMLSKALVKVFVVTEVLFAALFYCLVYLGTDYFGLMAVSVAHAINYLIYFTVIFLCLLKMKVL